MKIIGLEYDLARSQRAKFSHLKRVVDGLADLGFNLLSLNLENRFEFGSCPGMAPPGSLTETMAQKLVAHGRTRGVEVVPQLNLIGHCEGIGATERYAHLSCDPFQQIPWGGYEQLNLDIPEARARIRSMLEDVCRAFPGQYIHIGGDEVRQLAILYPDNPGAQTKALLENFAFVLEAARKTGRQVLMWGDMALHHAELMKTLPRDVIICDWHYGPAGSRETLERFQAEGFRVLAAPAVTTCAVFAVNPECSHGNIRKMVGDARELNLEGFLLNTWEFGYGQSFDLVWPWLEWAIKAACDTCPDDAMKHLAGFGERRYGVDGPAFARLHELLYRDIKEAFQQEGAPPPGLVRLRKSLFRGADPFAECVRNNPLPPNRHQHVWEVSPFHTWLYVRPVLTGRILARLEALAQESGMLGQKLAAAAGPRSLELKNLLGLTRAFRVMVDRLTLLQGAKADYHEAAMAQGANPAAFKEHLGRCADKLALLQPGITVLKAIVAELDVLTGYDPAEKLWLKLHERSLREHIAELKRKQFNGDALLEFGEFLLRPAGLTPRLTWR